MAESQPDTDDESLIRENIPYDGSPQYVAEIAEVLRGQSLSGEGIGEELDYSEGLIRLNANFGVELKFFMRENDRYELLERGKTLAHMGISESTEWVFQDAISEYNLYRSILERLFKKDQIEEVRGEKVFTQESVKEAIGGFDLDIGERILTGAGRTFMRTLDAARYGRYVRGDGDYPTRVVLSEEVYEFDVRTKIEDTDDPENEDNDDKNKLEDIQNKDINLDQDQDDITILVEVSEESDVDKLAKKTIRFRSLVQEHQNKGEDE